MSDERLSIAELESKRTGMSEPDRFVHDERTYRQFDIIGNDTSCWTDNSCDARGIVATVKAAPTLIAVAKAAMAWSEVRDEFQLRQTFSLREKLDRAGDVLVDALSKVRP